MNDHFIKMKSLIGELKISSKTRDYGVTVSTKEIVIHKPHLNYYVMLEHVVSMIPFDTKSLKPVSIVSERGAHHEITSPIPAVGAKYYKLHVEKATVHNRSGMIETGAMQFVIPLYGKIPSLIAEYGKLQKLI